MDIQSNFNANLLETFATVTCVYMCVPRTVAFVEFAPLQVPSKPLPPAGKLGLVKIDTNTEAYVSWPPKIGV